jgi:hypothetical protein
MAEYRLLFFRGSVLDRWEPIEAGSDLEAVQEAAKHQSAELVELWSKDGRIASFRPVGHGRR